jgi:dTDP-4-amino-4,6-dideoxygalactose transaminase
MVKSLEALPPTRADYRFPAIRPSFPPVEEWIRFCEPAYDRRWFSNFGPVLEKFEAELTRSICHEEESITCANSATSGLAAVLIALGVRGPVTVPAFTFPATASAVLMAGAEPMILDVELESWALSASLLEKFLGTQSCDAVVLVAPFGLKRDFSRHLEICRGRGIPVVIDNAAGLSEMGSPLSEENHFEVYSLHATKPFPIGEGGAIRSHASQSSALRRALNFGLEAGRAQPGAWGINGKLPEISAAIGRAVLRNFAEVLARRRSAAGRYIELLRHYEGLRFPTDPSLSSWQVFPVRISSAEAAESFVEKAARRGLQIRWSYKPTADHWPRTRKPAPCPNGETLSEQIVTLPIYSDMTAEEQTAILEIVAETLDAVLRSE